MADKDALDCEAVNACVLALKAKFAGSGAQVPEVTAAQLDRLVARATRGKLGSDDFDWLHSDGAVQEVAFTLDREGLEVFLKAPHLIDAMRALGWEDRWIRAKLESGLNFKLGVFPKSETTQRATWEGVFTLVNNIFPEKISAKVNQHTQELQSMSFKEIEAMGQAEGGFLGGPDGFFYDINTAAIKGQSSDPRYMSKERFGSDEVKGTLPEVRGFLYNKVSLNPLFDGNGYTKTEGGERGIAEYLVKNDLVANVKHHAYVDMPVTLADLKGEKEEKDEAA